MKISPAEYCQLVRQKAAPSPLWRDVAAAFLVGGLICVLGQMLTDLWLSLGLPQEEAGTAVSISLIFLSVLLTGLNLYNKAARFAGAGTLVPITGFANAVASPAIDFRAEGLVTGTAVKMFAIAGPVIVYGTAASVLYGVILWLFP